MAPPAAEGAAAGASSPGPGGRTAAWPSSPSAGPACDAVAAPSTGNPIPIEQTNSI